MTSTLNLLFDVVSHEILNVVADVFRAGLAQNTFPVSDVFVQSLLVSCFRFIPTIRRRLDFARLCDGHEKFQVWNNQRLDVESYQKVRRQLSRAPHDHRH